MEVRVSSSQHTLSSVFADLRTLHPTASLRDVACHPSSDERTEGLDQLPKPMRMAFHPLS